MRLFFHLYLILPQTQGAKHLYFTYLEPWIAENESDIDMFIASAHDRLKAAGMTYLKLAIEWLRVNILHLPPDETLSQQAAAPPAQQAPQSYITNLLSRFTTEPTTVHLRPRAAPANQSGWGTVGSDFYTMLANAVTAASGYSSATGAASLSSRHVPRGDMTASGTLIPDNLREAHPDDQLNFLSTQRERLQILMGVIDREAASIQVPGAFHSSASEAAYTPGSTISGASSSRPTSGLSKSRSEVDFEKIDAESGAEDESGTRRRQTANRQSSGWIPWAVNSGGGQRGRSSGLDYLDD